MLFCIQLTEKHQIIADRGFVNCKQSQGYFKLLTPAMLNNRPRLTQQEANARQRMAVII